MNRHPLPMLSHPLLRQLRYRLHSRLPRLYPGALCRVEQRNAVAITIDDGPGEATGALLAALREEALSATFFVSGEAAAENPGVLHRIADDGHGIATHGHAHADLSLRSRRDVREDIRRSIETVAGVTGRRPALFRPPYGRLNPLHRDLPAALGCRLVLWSSMPGDFDPALSAEELRRRLDGVRGGDIVVLHDRAETVERTVSGIHHLARHLRRGGLRAVTL